MEPPKNEPETGNHEHEKDKLIERVDAAETEPSPTVAPSEHPKPAVETEPTSEPPANPTPKTDDFPVMTSMSQIRNPRRAKIKWLLIFLLIVLLILAAVAGYLYFIKKEKPAHITSNKTANSSTTADQSPATSGIVWAKTATKLPDQKLFNDPDNLNPADGAVTFYQVGKTKEGYPVITVDIAFGLDGSTGLVIKKPDATYIIKDQSLGWYTKYDDKTGKYDTGEYVGPKLAVGVKQDTTTKIPELAIKDKLELNNVANVLETPEPNTFTAGAVNLDPTKKDVNSTSEVTLAATGANGKIYKVVSKKDAVTEQSYYILLRQDFRTVIYRVGSNLTFTTTKKGIETLSTANINWSDGSANKDDYIRQPSGCGEGSSNIIALNVKDSDLAVAGKSGSDNIYQAKSSSIPFESTFYKEYVDLTKDIDGSIRTDLILGQTAQQYLDKHAIILVKDGLGQYQVMINSRFAVVGGCGKPVIYLYPKVTTNVNVEVDARVVKSDPFYGNGWFNVLAQPSGQLNYQGHSYGSLFWEGYGNGIYPDVSKTGVVVSQSELLPTLRMQMTQLGLNAKEQTDFMAFWQAKLPTSPYVKLTWLTTRQMNELAPLHITPAPDTVIRVFLDSEGLNQPVSLNPQHFTAPARNGFTFVEWGGLLRDGIK